MSEESAKMVEENDIFGIPAVQERKMNNGHTARTINEDKKKAMPEEYFRWGVFGITVLLLFMATIEFYFSMQEAIRTWFEWQYVPLFKSVYNLVIMALCIYIIKLYVFRKQA